jgi:hypothetical protein
MSAVILIAFPAPLRRRALAAGPPLLFACALMVWGLLDPATAMPGNSAWGGLTSKILRLSAPFVRFDLWSETFCVLPLALLVWPGYPHWKELLHNSRARLCAVMVGAFLALYCVLPVSNGHGHDIDLRALALMYVGVLLTMLVAIDLGSCRLQFSAWLANVLLALANLWLLHHELLPVDRTLGAYRALLKVVPEQSSLLPVSAVPNIGRYQPFLHVGSWATIDRGAITPYLFSGSTGDAMSYFRYVHLPRAPSIFWAIRPEYPRPDCAQISRDFAYVAIIGEATVGCSTFVSVAHSSDGEISILKREGYR